MALETLQPVSNNGQHVIDMTQPYIVDIEITGAAALLFHAWNCESVGEKAKAAKGSKAKKSDDVESYVYRDKAGFICLPGEYIRMSIINAAKFQQDPRSPRKSAMDLFKAGFVMLDELCSLGTKNWDYLDQRRCKVQMSSITRQRPAMEPGWKVCTGIQVLVPEYISPALLHETLNTAGRLVGVGDFRPTYGRFQVTTFQVRAAC